MKILKLSSKGTDVKNLQSFLGIKSDGIFGTITQKSVINFQKRNKLVPDGIVGEKTYQVLFNLGFKSDNLQEVYRFEIKNQLLPEAYYFKGPTKKRWIFLHHTHGWHNPYKVVDDWKMRTTKVATHFVIGGIDIFNEDFAFDGEIVQAMPEESYAWQLGIGNTEMHRESIGIELCSFGYLNNGFYYKTINEVKTKIVKEPNKFYTTTGQEVHESQVEILAVPFRGQSYFHKYSDKQIQALQKLLEYLSYTHQIDISKGLSAQIKLHGALAFDLIDVNLCKNNLGVWSHTNVAKGKWDVAPQTNLLKILK